ncbi:GNAT family N-acetyltransferase [Pseudooceanicola sp. 216_PA32_1]|uniref:GNAT family N-acetyltransferase n=2 Tax=Pseudooceanicola pacificus TaxID=2676438 RepID=A0A844WGY5_9RHOB|nr:GNAT family N-acetyltransferase [Pseudooceanicola pacificus]
MADRPEVRRARLWHVPRLARILWSFTRTTPWLPRVRTKGDDLKMMTRITRQGWVRLARDAKGPAAFIARDGQVIHALYVHPRARRQGLGRRLLDDAKARADRLELWTLQANREARAFYAAQGFAEAGRSDGRGNDEYLPDIRMVWLRRGDTADER